MDGGGFLRYFLLLLLVRWRQLKVDRFLLVLGLPERTVWASIE